MDTLETIKGSVIQHGTHNDRIYLMRFNTDDTQGLVTILDDMALAKGYGKIFAKIPALAWNAFKSAGYVKEVVVPGLFAGKVDGFFIAKYFSNRRQETQNVQNLLRIISPDRQAPTKNIHPMNKAAPEVVPCELSDATEMSLIYQQVFKSYPFPIQKPTYLQHMMKKGVLYFCIRIKGRIAAIAAAEIDLVNKNVEMTDFATLPQWRCMGFAGLLLNHMGKHTRKLGIKTAYTIARAESTGMNSVFKNSGYKYSGLLKNNSQICGKIQSMAVWYKHL